MNQLTIFDYPDHPGSKDNETGREAAEAMATRAPRLRALVVASLGHGPKTADETAVALGIDKLSIRPRFTEAQRKGLIEWTGETRRNASGRRAKVYRLRRTT